MSAIPGLVSFGSSRPPVIRKRRAPLVLIDRWRGPELAAMQAAEHETIGLGVTFHTD